MPQRKQPQRRSVDHFSLSLAAGTITIGGKRFEGRTVNYELTEFDDGTFEEIGLPPGMAPKPTMAQLMAWVFEPPVAPVRRRVRARIVANR